MPFGDLSINPAAFAPQRGTDFLGQFAAVQQLQRDQQMMALMQQEQQRKNQLREAMAGFDPARPDEGLAKLYAIDPQAAFGLKESMAKAQKADLELGNTRLSGIKAQGEIAKGDQEQLVEHAKFLAAQAWALPPEQRTPERLDQLRVGIINLLDATNPKLAAMYRGKSHAPEFWDNVQAIARAKGLEDPALAAQRDMAKFQAQEGYKAQLPPTPYQQEELALKRQGVQAETGQRQFGVENWFVDQYEKAPEVVTYKRVLPKAQAVYNAIQRKDPQSSLDIVYGLTNMLDELGSVRETDLANIQSASSWNQWLDNLKHEIEAKGKLGEKARQGIKAIVDSRLGEFGESYAARKRHLLALAQDRGVERPERLFSEPMQTAPEGRGAALPSASTGSTTPARPRYGDPQTALQQAQQLLQARPDKRAQIMRWLQQQGIDPAALP